VTNDGNIRLDGVKVSVSPPTLSVGPILVDSTKKNIGTLTPGQSVTVDFDVNTAPTMSPQKPPFTIIIHANDEKQTYTSIKLYLQP